LCVAINDLGYNGIAVQFLAGDNFEITTQTRGHSQLTAALTQSSHLHPEDGVGDVSAAAWSLLLETCACAV